MKQSALKAATALLSTVLILTTACALDTAATPSSDQPTDQARTTAPNPEDRYLIIYDQGELRGGSLEEKLNVATAQGYTVISISPMPAMTYGYITVLERNVGTDPLNTP